jgi:hypothetical protein
MQEERSDDGKALPGSLDPTNIGMSCVPLVFFYTRSDRLLRALLLQLALPAEDESLDKPTRLRPLSSLKWPNVPPPPAIPDPLTINDPKPLQIAHYEAIGECRRFIVDSTILIL